VYAPPLAGLSTSPARGAAPDLKDDFFERVEFNISQARKGLVLPSADPPAAITTELPEECQVKVDPDYMTLFPHLTA
jgi:hypothetical protein